jgi:chromosome segregation ATPase
MKLNKNALLNQFLSVKTTKQFAQIKEEISGLKQEKEDAFLTLQEQKRKLMYDKEDITITRMLNFESGRQIADIDKNTEECVKKRLLVKGNLAQVNQEVRALEHSDNVFNQTLRSLDEANETEKSCIMNINDQIKQLRSLLAEERIQHEQYRGIVMLQRK